MSEGVMLLSPGRPQVPRQQPNPDPRPRRPAYRGTALGFVPVWAIGSKTRHQRSIDTWGPVVTGPSVWLLPGGRPGQRSDQRPIRLGVCLGYPYEPCLPPLPFLCSCPAFDRWRQLLSPTIRRGDGRRILRVLPVDRDLFTATKGRSSANRVVPKLVSTETPFQAHSGPGLPVGRD